MRLSFAHISVFLILLTPFGGLSAQPVNPVINTNSPKSPQSVIVDNQEGIMLTGFHPMLTRRPRLGGNGTEDKERMQKAINSNENSAEKERYLKIKNRVDPFILQHDKDPDFLMSRMPMYWGKHYTVFPTYGDKEKMEYSDFDSPHKVSFPHIMSSWKAEYLDMRKMSGHAPVPTIRVGFSRENVNKAKVKALDITESEPYCGDLVQYQSKNKEDSTAYWQPYTGGLVIERHGKMFNLAADAAMLYYWTEDERYAKFACDYLMQFVLAIHFQNRYNRPFAIVEGQQVKDVRSTGLNGTHIQTGYNKRISWVYDLCYDYLQKNERHYLDGKFYPHRQGEIDYAALKKAMEDKTINEVIDGAFYKFLYDFLMQNVLGNNHCIWTQQAVDFFLAIENHQLRAQGMDIILYSDELLGKIHPGRGSRPVYSSIEKSVSEDGFWMESTNYQVIAAGRLRGLLMKVAAVGYDNVLEQNAQALKTASAPLRLIMPDGDLAVFGDGSGGWRYDAGVIRGLYQQTHKYKLDEAKELGSQLRWVIDHGLIEPLSPEEMKDLPKKGQGKIAFGRTDQIDFITMFLQRNKGLDKDNGLMNTMYCGPYIHAQPEGISFEYFSNGLKMVPHVGYYGYGSKNHSGFCQKIGSKNTVIPGDTPMSTEDIPKLQKYAMEPEPLTEGVSPEISFLETELAYGGRQRRCMALIRTSPTGGFLVDIFRSSNPESNEYRLHSIGKGVSIYDENGMVKMQKADTSRLFNIKLGDDFLDDRMQTENTPKGNLKIAFDVEDENRSNQRDFNFFMPGRSDYSLFTFTGLPREGASKSFRKMRSPGMAVRIEDEAWNKPFVAVYEGAEKGKSTIKAVNRLADGPFTILNIEESAATYLVMSADSPEEKNTFKDYTFQGTFAVVKTADSATEIYLGKGTELTTPICSIEGLEVGEFSASVRINSNNVVVSTTAPCKVTINGISKSFRTGLDQTFADNEEVVSVQSNKARTGSMDSTPYAGDASDFVKNYPGQVKILMDQLDWERDELKVVKNDDAVLTCQALVRYFKQSDAMAKERARPILKKSKALGDKIVNEVENAKRKPDGLIDFGGDGFNNRFGSVINLAGAWHETGDEKYHETLKLLIHDLFNGHPPIFHEALEARRMDACWVTLNAAIRMGSLFEFLTNYQKHPQMEEETFLLVLSMFFDIANFIYIYGEEGRGNWTTTESERLLRMLIHYPEFKDSEKWKQKAVERFTNNMNHAIYPDGAQCELSIGYGYIVFASAIRFYDYMVQGNIDIPDVYLTSLKQQMQFYAWTCSPDGNSAPAGDSQGDNNGLTNGMGYAEKLNDEEAIYLLSKGEKGKVPEGPPSRLMDWSGYAVSRDGFGNENTQWSFFDMGPYGTGHVQRDALSLSIYNKRRILVDPGRGYPWSWDGWDEGYFKACRAHNTIGVGGCDQFFPHWRVGNENWDLNEYYYSLSTEPIGKENYEITATHDFFRGRTHNGYVGFNDTGTGYGPRLVGKNSHERGVYYKRGQYWAVIDRVFTDKKQSIEAFWHFHPNVKKVEMMDNGAVVTLDKGQGNLMLLPVHGNQTLKGKLFYGSEEPKQGWFAPNMNTKVPAWAVEYYGSAESLGWFAWLIIPFDDDKIPEVSKSIVTHMTGNLYRIETVINGKTDQFEMQLNDTPEFEEDKYYRGIIPAYILKQENKACDIGSKGKTKKKKRNKE